MSQSNSNGQGDILIVDDERDIRQIISDILVDEGYTTRVVATAENALSEVNREAPALIILDIWLKGSRVDGIEVLKSVHRDNPDVPVIIISGHGNIGIAVAAIKEGAFDFIEKPFNIDQILVVVSRAMEVSRLRRENSTLRLREIASSVMLGNSQAFKAMKSRLDKVVRSNARVLLYGPPGSGKEVAARYIHANSGRSTAPFVSVNSASVEPGEMEVVLFGRESAERGHEPGLFEQAHGGILFFDEIADMPFATQSKILRVLVEQQFIRVGGSDRVRVDVRVIASTTRDLKEEIAAGAFREELYHRLNVVPITVPSLEQRCEDIATISNHFIKEFNLRNGFPLRALSEDARCKLQMMKWPGNVRQLRNIIERVLILGPHDQPICPNELVDREHGEDGEAFDLGLEFMALNLRDARAKFERSYLLSQVKRFGGNVSRTAEFVGMERTALHRKLRTLEIVTPGGDGVRVAEGADGDDSGQDNGLGNDAAQRDSNGAGVPGTPE